MVRLLGTVSGVILGAVVGGGTGIVGGPFGAMAGASVFMIGGGLRGFSADPDLAQKIREWRSNNPR